MNLYLFIFIFPMMIFFFAHSKHTIILNNKILAFLFGVILILMAGLRINISTDYWSYAELFYGTKDSSRLEPIFNFIIKTVRDIDKNNFNLFIFLIALISLGTKTYYVSKLYNPFLGFFIFICIYYFNLDYNIIRQGTAAAFILLAIEYGRQKRKFKYLLFILIASGFHFSSLIFLPCYSLSHRMIYLTKKIFLILISTIITLRLTIIPLVLGVIRNIIIHNFSNPQILQICNYLELGDFYISLSSLRRLSFLMIYIFFFGTKNLNCYFIFYFLGFLTNIILTGNEIFAHRLSLCFDIFSIPLFANRKIPFTIKNIPVFILFLFILTILYFYPIKEVVPYQTYLSF